MDMYDGSCRGFATLCDLGDIKKGRCLLIAGHNDTCPAKT